MLPRKMFFSVHKFSQGRSEDGPRRPFFLRHILPVEEIADRPDPQCRVRRLNDRNGAMSCVLRLATTPSAGFLNKLVPGIQRQLGIEEHTAAGHCDGGERHSLPPERAPGSRQRFPRRDGAISTLRMAVNFS